MTYIFVTYVSEIPLQQVSFLQEIIPNQEFSHYFTSNLIPLNLPDKIKGGGEKPFFFKTLNLINILRSLNAKQALRDLLKIIPFFMWFVCSCMCTPIPGGGGHSTSFSGRGVLPGFPKCGACELILASEKGGLWNENSHIWGACEWKISKFGGLWAENFQIWGLWAKFWVKIEAVEAKISKFSQKGSCELIFLLEIGPLRTAGEAWKGGLQGRTSPYPLSRSVPPRDTNIYLSVPLPPGKTPYRPQ